MPATKFKINAKQDIIKTVTDWDSLGALIGVKVNLLTWCLHERENMQTKIRLGKRTVYKSGTYLHFIQKRIEMLVTALFDELPDTDCAIAYRKGQKPVDVLREIPHAKLLITTDVRKYYDNITLEHLTKALEFLGFPHLGAKLIARYCVVRNDRNHRLTLQQGCPASPVLSNLVGHVFFDLPFRKWLDETYPDVTMRYVRYCDNLALFVLDEYPSSLPGAVSAKLTESLREHGFRLHKWRRIPDNHPMVNQSFLGIVLNHEKRVALDYADRLRATLFTWCRLGKAHATNQFIEENGLVLSHAFIARDLQQAKFVAHMRGCVQYVQGINEKQGKMLRKLLNAAELLDQNEYSTVRMACNLDSEIFRLLKTYRNNNESPNAYTTRLQQALSLSRFVKAAA